MVWLVTAGSLPDIVDAGSVFLFRLYVPVPEFIHIRQIIEPGLLFIVDSHFDTLIVDIEQLSVRVKDILYRELKAGPAVGQGLAEAHAGAMILFRHVDA